MAKKTTEPVPLFFIKNTTEIVFLWPNMGQLWFKVSIKPVNVDNQSKAKIKKKYFITTKYTNRSTLPYFIIIIKNVKINKD